MPTSRDNQFDAFSYYVTIRLKSGNKIHGGFSEVSGLNADITFSDYRRDIDQHNYAEKLPTTYKAANVTLKRGLLNQSNLCDWMGLALLGDIDAKASVTIDLKAENRDIITRWRLESTLPIKCTTPSPTANRTSLVTIEELGLVCESIFFD